VLRNLCTREWAWSAPTRGKATTDCWNYDLIYVTNKTASLGQHEIIGKNFTFTHTYLHIHRQQQQNKQLRTYKTAKR